MFFMMHVCRILIQTTYLSYLLTYLQSGVVECSFLVCGDMLRGYG